MKYLYERVVPAILFAGTGIWFFQRFHGFVKKYDNPDLYYMAFLVLIISVALAILCLFEPDD